MVPLELWFDPDSVSAEVVAEVLEALGCLYGSEMVLESDEGEETSPEV